jgi:CheY-like chemotaxis protein/anti-sigma regulatory factor (Ser/Thr protein kinase)
MMETLRREKAEADRASQQKTAFLAAASHDLRQPVHALGLLIEALAENVQLDATDRPDLRRLVRRIQDSAGSVQRMLHSLLDLSKLDAGALEVEVNEFALGPLLAELAEEFRETAARKGLRLSVVSTRCWVRSDPILLRRIVQNLIANAVRYTDDGGVVVGCRRSAGALAIAVYDTGPGIAAPERERIFREYERIRTGGSGGAEGLGLGLAIVRRLGALLGHRISLESEPRRGSRFAVHVPRAEARVLLPRAARAATPANLTGLRVLVVDDDRATRDGMQALLEPWGCRVLAADSVAAVRRSLAENGGDVDAILADYHLSDSETGLDAIRVARERVHRDIPALLMTGDASGPGPTVTELLVLTKPVPPAQLRAALAHLVGGRGRPV